MVVSSAMHVEVQSPTPVQLADVLLAVRLSRSSDDRYVHVSSIIKALRWGVRHLGLDCFQCAHSAIGGRLLHTKIPKDVMSGRVYHSLSSRSSDGNERFLLGTFPRFWRSSWGAFFFKPGLVCVGQTSNESAPPVWYSISRTSVIRGLAWRTKTTTKGQAFVCVAHGFMSVSTHTWLLVWLRHLDVVFKEADPASVDFLIPQTTINWSCHLSWNPCVMWMHSTICENM
jgi:hypothetical protein